MEFTKRSTKILVKDENGRIIQVIPETEASSVFLNGDPLTEVIEEIESGKSDVGHGHVINDVASLQDALDAKNPLIADISNDEVLALLST